MTERFVMVRGRELLGISIFTVETVSLSVGNAEKFALKPLFHDEKKDIEHNTIVLLIPI